MKAILITLLAFSIFALIVFGYNKAIHELFPDYGTPVYFITVLPIACILGVYMHKVQQKYLERPNK